MWIYYRFLRILFTFLCPLLIMVLSQPCPRSPSRDLIMSLFTFRRRPSSGVRVIINSLGCARPRRGRRAGKPSRAANNDVTGSPGEIPVIIGRRQLIDVGKFRQEHRISALTTVRRHGNLDPINVGVFNARSIHNKHTSLAQWIADRRLSVACLVETWHDSHDCPDLIACAPTGYNYVDRPRPLSNPTSVSLHVNHGGVALHLRQVALPDYTSFEHVRASLQCSRFSSLVIVIYRPGSIPASDAFFTDFADLLERVATYVNLLIVGDVNIHLDDATDARTIKFCRLRAVHNLKQHVNVPTQSVSHA